LTVSTGHTGREAGGASGLAKTVIAIQSVANLFLSAWVYEEYRNNEYFHAYVNNTLATPVPTTTLLSIVAIVMISGGLLAGRKSRQRKIRMGLAFHRNIAGAAIVSVSKAGTLNQPSSSSSKTQTVVPKGTEIVVVTAPKSSLSQVEAARPFDTKSQ
jgi:hypothetical protein